MGDPFLTLKFAQSLGQQKPLTQIGQGIAEVGGIWQQVQQQREQERLMAAAQQGHQNTLQRYMEDPTAENKMAVFQTGQGIGQDFETTQGMISAVEQQRAEEAEAARLAELQENFTTGLKTFANAQNYDNLAELLASAEEAGKLDEAREIVEGLETNQRRRIAGQYGQVYTALANNDGNAALDMAEKYANAYEGQEGMELQADYWDRISEYIDNGQITQAKTALAMYSAATEEGQEVMKGIFDVFEEDRSAAAEEREVEAQRRELVEMGIGQQYTQEELDRLANVAANDPELGDIAEAILRYANLVDEGMAEDPMAVREFELDLQDRWRKYNQKLDGVKTAHTSLQNIADDIRTNGAGSGWVDPETLEVVEEGTPGAVRVEGTKHVAAMNLFQRMIDPATVRQGDIDLINSANNIVDRFKLSLQNLSTGAKITNDQMQEMMEVARSLEQANQNWVDENAYPALNNIVETTPGALWDNVFKGYTPPDERPGMDEARDEFQSAKDFLLQGVTDQRVIDHVRSLPDVESIRKHYPNALEGWVSPVEQLNSLKEHIIAANKDQDYWSDEREEWVRNATEEEIARRYSAGYREFIDRNAGGTGAEILDLFNVGGGN